MSGIFAWAALVGVGVRFLHAKATTPGERGQAEAEWPAASALQRSTQTPTVVMFVHPRCACSRASLTELNLTLQHAHAKAYVVFLHPDGVEPDWAKSDTWHSAARLPNAERVIDHGGREAALFGAKTSGHVVVYDAGGALRFAGGITGSRAHEGENTGRVAVENALLGRRADPAHDVFGCAMNDKKP